MTADAAALFREAIAADQACIAVVRAPLEYRPLTEAENRLCELLEERIAHTTVGMLKLLEVES